MGKKLVITLDEATTSKYLELMHKMTEAEVNADCEPSSRRLIIDIAPEHYGGSTVSFRNDNIGNVSVDFVDD
jgi:hypothetical protein